MSRGGEPPVLYTTLKMSVTEAELDYFVQTLMPAGAHGSIDLALRSATWTYAQHLGADPPVAFFRQHLTRRRD